MALGSFGRDTDIERLKTIALGDDELLATGALSGLIISNKQAAISEVERISIDAALPEQRRKLAGQLLGMPRPSPLPGRSHVPDPRDHVSVRSRDSEIGGG